MNARAAADALFKGPVERIVRRTRRVGSLRKLENDFNRRQIAGELRRIEGMAARLTVWRNDPERFHVDKGELKAAIGSLAKQIEER